MEQPMSHSENEGLSGAPGEVGRAGESVSEDRTVARQTRSRKGPLWKSKTKHKWSKQNQRDKQSHLDAHGNSHGKTRKWRAKPSRIYVCVLNSQLYLLLILVHSQILARVANWLLYWIHFSKLSRSPCFQLPNPMAPVRPLTAPTSCSPLLTAAVRFHDSLTPLPSYTCYYSPGQLFFLGMPFRWD